MVRMNQSSRTTSNGQYSDPSGKLARLARRFGLSVFCHLHHLAGFNQKSTKALKESDWLLVFSC
jgi:hypothetical protein